jgi:hypothetical protein
MKEFKYITFYILLDFKFIRSFSIVILSIFFSLNLSAAENRKLKKSSRTGKIYFHKINLEKEKSKFEVYLDGKKVNDLDKLDAYGISLPAGQHNLKLKGLSFNPGLEEIKYDLKPNQELHLYYCEEDGSFHNYTNFTDEERQIKYESPGLNFHEFAVPINKRRSALKEICRPSN